MMTPTEYECHELRESMKVLLFLKVLLFEGIVQPFINILPVTSYSFYCQWQFIASLLHVGMCEVLSCHFFTGSWYSWRCADWDPLHSNQWGDSCHKTTVQTQWALLATWIACTCTDGIKWYSFLPPFSRIWSWYWKGCHFINLWSLQKTPSLHAHSETPIYKLLFSFLFLHFPLHSVYWQWSSVSIFLLSIQSVPDDQCQYLTLAQCTLGGSMCWSSEVPSDQGLACTMSVQAIHKPFFVYVVFKNVFWWHRWSVSEASNLSWIPEFFLVDFFLTLSAIILPYSVSIASAFLFV